MKNIILHNNKSQIDIKSGEPIIVMMCGLPGSGKSTLAESITISENNKEYKPVIHSSDSLRKEIYGNESTQGDANKVFGELHKRIKNDLIAGKDVVYDATNISKKFRIQFLNELKNISCTPICLCMMTSYETCLNNNKKRDRQVPIEVVKRMQMNWQPPHYNEGFKEIKYIFSNLDDEYADKFTISNFFNIANKFDQENSHHTLTLGEHCTKAATYIQEHCSDNYLLLIATLLHDNGKLHTKTKTNARGIEDGNCHYYQHHSYGSYECLFYLHFAKQFTEPEMTYISNLIYYHMHPYCQWKQSKKRLNKDKMLLGDTLFNDIMLLHDADLYAH